MVIKDDEIEIRTKEKGMLMCTASHDSEGKPFLISRYGKKEDTMSIDDLLTQVYGRHVMVVTL